MKGGLSYGETDALGYNATSYMAVYEKSFACLLSKLRFDHKRFTHPFQGLDQRLTNVTKTSRILHDIIS